MALDNLQAQDYYQREPKLEGETGDMSHWLDPLLRPRSIAIFGATPDPGVVGHTVTRNIIAAGFSGPVWAVNPKHTSVLGLDCVGSLGEISEPIDHVMLAIAQDDLPESLAQAIDKGVRAVAVFSAMDGGAEEDRSLATRLRDMAGEANVPLCAGGDLELLNFRDRVYASGFPTQPHGHDGSVALISHSGPALRAILEVEERLTFNLAIACGQELTVGLEDHLNWMLDQRETKVVGLVIGELRQPRKFLAALEKANDNAIPIIALAAGRNVAYEAVFERFGIARARDLEELTTTLIMFAQPHRPKAGGLAAMHTSDFEARLTAGLAAELDVPMTDAKGSTSDAFEDALGAQSAMGAVILPQPAAGETLAAHADKAAEAARTAHKPVFLVSALPGAVSGSAAVTSKGERVPVLGGLIPFLRGAKHLLDYRDFRRRPPARSRTLRGQIKIRWRERLQDGPLDLMETLLLLSDYQIPVNSFAIADSASDAWRRAKEIGLPVALKPAARGINSETLAARVLGDLNTEAAVTEAYEALATKYGAEVHVSSMVFGGVEISLTMLNDAQFGPLVSVGVAGANADALDDRVFALPPFDTQGALRLIGRLKLGDPNSPTPVDLRALAGAFARFSDLADALGREFTRIDIDPIIAAPTGAFVLHAETVSRRDKATP